MVDEERPIVTLDRQQFSNYLAGFFDGDGCIQVEKSRGGFSVRIKFSQSHKNTLLKIQEYYPYLKLGGRKRSDSHRTEYELRAAGSQIKPLVDDLIEYSVLKREQLIEAKKCFHLWTSTVVLLRRKIFIKICAKLRKISRHRIMKK